MLVPGNLLHILLVCTHPVLHGLRKHNHLPSDVPLRTLFWDEVHALVQTAGSHDKYSGVILYSCSGSMLAASTCLIAFIPANVNLGKSASK